MKEVLHPRRQHPVRRGHRLRNTELRSHPLRNLSRPDSSGICEEREQDDDPVILVRNK